MNKNWNLIELKYKNCNKIRTENFNKTEIKLEYKQYVR